MPAATDGTAATPDGTSVQTSTAANIASAPLASAVETPEVPPSTAARPSTAESRASTRLTAPRLQDNSASAPPPRRPASPSPTVSKRTADDPSPQKGSRRRRRRTDGDSRNDDLPAAEDRALRLELRQVRHDAAAAEMDAEARKALIIGQHRDDVNKLRARFLCDAAFKVWLSQILLRRHADEQIEASQQSWRLKVEEIKVLLKWRRRRHSKKCKLAGRNRR
jgi:hypothetical protein